MFVETGKKFKESFSKTKNKKSFSKTKNKKSVVFVIQKCS